MSPERPLCLLLGALGGQGGGVLTDWLVEAARIAGYPAQATSIPGVAQRTGATTYYFELFPEKEPPADPVFCLFPSAGDVDLVAALEPTEAGRALQGGYVSKRTTVVTATKRIYSTAEKSIAGNGAVAVEPILGALSQAAARVIPVEAAGAGQLNAAIFGAVIASSVLPLEVAHGRAAIQARGLAVAANLESFQAGLEAARLPAAPAAPPAASPASLHFQPAPPVLAAALGEMPAPLRPLIGHALARLVDYQDEAYARRYLARLRPLLALEEPGRDFRLTAEVARRLGAWMSYEDVSRVAQLKTRPGRLTRIQAEVGAGPGEPLAVTDFFTPGRGELLSLLPATIARLLPAGGDPMAGGSGLALPWPTSSPFGFAALRLLAALRRLRPRSLTFAREQEAIDAWLAAVVAAASLEYELGCQVAALAVWARGYGRVRARGLARLRQLSERWPERLALEPDVVRAEVAASLLAARRAPDG